jgi:hypothetical protein
MIHDWHFGNVAKIIAISPSGDAVSPNNPIAKTAPTTRGIFIFCYYLRESI